MSDDHLKITLEQVKERIECMTIYEVMDLAWWMKNHVDHQMSEVERIRKMLEERKTAQQLGY